MPHRRWLINQETSRKRKIILDQIVRRADYVINHESTREKQLVDFPAVYKYLSTKFPVVDLSAVKLYITPPRVMEKAGWKDIGGCYIRNKKVILVKSEINHYSKPKGEFQHLMHEICKMKTDVEDVIVHELIHAVSDIIGRSLSKYQHMEEEFVYTNCIEFYYEKNMTDGDIVNNNFLPFCIQDIYESVKDMSSIFAKVGHTVEDIRQMSKEEYQRFLNVKADVIVPLIKSQAQERAYKMIELFHKYGAQMHKTSATEVVEDQVAMRFSSLDLG